MKKWRFFAVLVGYYLMGKFVKENHVFKMALLTKNYLPIKWAGSQRPTPLYLSEVKGKWVKTAHLEYQYKIMNEEK